jgi:hypothetical protein
MTTTSHLLGKEVELRRLLKSFFIPQGREAGDFILCKEF